MKTHRKRDPWQKCTKSNSTRINSRVKIYEKKKCRVIVKKKRRETGEFCAKVMIGQSVEGQVVGDANHLSHCGILGTYHIVQEKCWFRKNQESSQGCGQTLS